MPNELAFRMIARAKLTDEDCAWFNPQYFGGFPEHDQVLLALRGGECVCYAMFEEAGDIELKYVENSAGGHGKGHARQVVGELLRRSPDRIVYAVPVHEKAPALLRASGFQSPEDVTRERGGFRIGGAWVRFPPAPAKNDDAAP
jgi:hypothetical protein